MLTPTFMVLFSMATQGQIINLTIQSNAVSGRHAAYNDARTAQFLLMLFSWLWPTPISLHYQNVYKVRNQRWYLPLALFELPGIDVILLKPSEVELTRSNVITMGCEEHDWNLELFKNLYGCLRIMIACPVKQNHCFLSP